MEQKKTLSASDSARRVELRPRICGVKRQSVCGNEGMPRIAMMREREWRAMCLFDFGVDAVRERGGCVEGA
eukprot:397347-Rhodomonas_salina.3